MTFKHLQGLLRKAKGSQQRAHNVRTHTPAPKGLLLCCCLRPLAGLFTLEDRRRVRTEGKALWSGPAGV